jgi:CubicO group peptidase (beta-lactamase class C family)
MLARPLTAAVAASFVALVGAVTQAPQSAPWPTDRWPTASFADVGMRAEPLQALEADVRAGAFGHVDRVFVVARGRAVVDWRLAHDYRAISRGRVSPIGCGDGCTDPSAMHEYNYLHPNWHPYYRGREVHTLQSVTKSIAATAMGVALGRGDLARLDVLVLDFFRDRDLTRVDPRLRRATLDDVLTMRSGIEWHEQDRPLDDTNTTIQLERSRDWIGFTLSQPMDADPGTKWAYNSGGSMLLSGVIQSATGRHIDEYAAEHLFLPIGIREFHWKKTPTGHPDTEGGLYLSAEDLARVGYLYLRGGRWNGRQVLPEGWVSRATTRHVTGVAPGWDYGYQWWITRRGDVDIWAGRGFGGQLLLVIPSRDIVAVAFAWNVFGGRARALAGPLMDALVAAPLPRRSSGALFSSAR